MSNNTVTEEFVRDMVSLAVKHKKQVKISYLDKKGNGENRIIEPFDAGDKNFGGHCHLRNNYRNFSYDRVLRIVLTDINHTVDVTKYQKAKA